MVREKEKERREPRFVPKKKKKMMKEDLRPTSSQRREGGGLRSMPIQEKRNSNEPNGSLECIYRHNRCTYNNLMCTCNLSLYLIIFFIIFYF